MEIESKPKQTVLTKDEIKRRLAAFEKRHGMTSEIFLKRYNTGDLRGDPEEERDYIRWAGLLAVAAKVGALDKVHA